jgi:transcriptional regulator GlxA family with amidase domain
MRISVLVFRDCMAMISISAVELLRKSDLIRAAVTGDPTPFFEVELVAADTHPTVIASYGFPVRCDRTLSDPPITDLVVVPAFDDDVVAQMERNRAAVEWVRAAYDHGADVASVCTGAFVLAEAGLLDGRTATTHWNSQDLFHERYPKVKLLSDRIILDEGRVCTSGGAMSFLNLVMYVVQKYCGEETARVASKICLIDLHKGSQDSYAIISGRKDHADLEVRTAQALIEKRLHDSLRVTDLAREVAISPRHFVRRFKAATGSTPVEYMQRMKVEAAKRALENSRTPISEVAVEVGYEDTASFRMLFKRVAGVSPTEYRRRFSPLLATI